MFSPILHCCCIGIFFAAIPCFANEAIEEVLNATCRLVNQQTSGTCFFVSVPATETSPTPQIVLITAGHFFTDATGEHCQLIARSQQDDQTFTRREVKLAIRAHDQPLWKKHPEVDIAALSVQLPEDVTIKPLKYEQLASEQVVEERQVRVADEVYVPGYPAKLEGNVAGWPVLRKGIIASHPLIPVKDTKTMLVHANTFGGDSGAPVVKGEKTVQVVGLVSGMQRQTDRATLPFEEHVNHTPLALAIVVQAPYIRETIELFDK